jgi:hypothetical protein
MVRIVSSISTYFLRIPRKVRSLEPSLCCSSVTVAVSTVGGASDDAMMGGRVGDTGANGEGCNSLVSGLVQMSLSALQKRTW